MYILLEFWKTDGTCNLLHFEKKCLLQAILMNSCLVHETKLNKLCICWDYSLKIISQIVSIVWFQQAWEIAKINLVTTDQDFPRDCSL